MAEAKTITIRDIQSLADRLLSRGLSQLSDDRPEHAGDLRLAAKPSAPWRAASLTPTSSHSKTATDSSTGRQQFRRPYPTNLSARLCAGLLCFQCSMESACLDPSVNLNRLRQERSLDVGSCYPDARKTRDGAIAGPQERTKMCIPRLTTT